MNQIDSIKVSIVCSSRLLGTSFKLLLESNSGFEVVGETKTLNQALSNLEKEKPNIILLDLPNDDEIKAIEFSSAIPNNVSVVALVNSNDSDLNQRCLELGLRGVIVKNQKSVVLFKALTSVCAGEYWFERAAMVEVIKNLLNERKAFYENPELIKIASLTTREKEVLGLVGQGFKNKKIAAHLFISENTVRHHFRSIFGKLDVAGRLELVVYAFKHNLVRLNSVFFILACINWLS